MLQSLRKAADTWVMKGLLVIMVFAFGIWGVHASIFAGGSSAVVTVGDQKVSNSEFRMAFSNAVNAMSQQFGVQLTLEQAKQFGAEQMVYGQLVSSAALDQLASDMKLGLTEDRIISIIQQQAAFKDRVTGSFSRETMFAVLANQGIRQEDFLSSIQRQAVRNQITEAIESGFTPPKTLTDALKAYSTEARSIDYLILTNANIEPIKPPADDVLAKWYETRKANYRAPEYRKFNYVKLEPADIADASAISEDAVKADYEARKDSYRTPETRTIEQLTFPDKAQADAAAAKLAAGTTFAALVSEQGKTATDVLLGDFQQKTMPSKAMGDAAFAIKADGGITPVTDGLVGPVIMRITNITPESVKTYDDVKDQIRKDLALNNANDEITNVYKSVEDVMASGSSLEETAKQNKLRAVTVAAIGADGTDMKGVEVMGIPSPKLTAEVFRAEAGVQTAPLQLDNGGYIWYELKDVIAARDRKLDEVKAKVLTDWTVEQQKAALAAKADDILKQVKGGARMADIATTLKIAVESKTGIRRGMNDPVLGASAVTAAFGGPNGYVATSVGEGGENQIVLQVTEVNDNVMTDALDNPDAQANALAESAGQEIVNQMVGELQTVYGVSFNKTLANQLMVQR